MKVQAILGFRLVTSDAVRLAGFYRALGFTVAEPAPISATEMELLELRGSGSRIALSLGPSRLDLDSFDDAGRPYPQTRSCDLIFQHLAIVTSDAAAAWRHARLAGGTPISRQRPETLPPSTGSVTAVKFRDPEGHPLEFLQFPCKSGSDWRGIGNLGIDHTAMSTGGVRAAQQFYSRLGLSQGETTMNKGPTQEALDALDGVEVVVAPMLLGDRPPHVELLGYRHPVGRANAPLAANDIAATRIVFRSDRDALIRNPDGHLHQLSRSDL